MSAALLGDQGVVLRFSGPVCPEHLLNEMLSPAAQGEGNRAGELGHGPRPREPLPSDMDEPPRLPRDAQAALTEPQHPGAELALGGQMLSLGQSRACRAGGQNLEGILFRSPGSRLGPRELPCQPPLPGALRIPRPRPSTPPRASPPPWSPSPPPTSCPLSPERRDSRSLGRGGLGPEGAWWGRGGGRG